VNRFVAALFVFVSVPALASRGAHPAARSSGGHVARHAASGGRASGKTSGGASLSAAGNASAHRSSSGGSNGLIGNALPREKSQAKLSALTSHVAEMGHHAKKPVVVFDIDDTLVKSNFRQKPDQVQAEPGAVAYVKSLARSGATIVYLTNRREPDRAATEATFRHLGLPFGTSKAQLMMNPSKKWVPALEWKSSAKPMIEALGKPVGAADDEPVEEVGSGARVEVEREADDRGARQAGGLLRQRAGERAALPASVPRERGVPPRHQEHPPRPGRQGPHRRDQRLPVVPAPPRLDFSRLEVLVSDRQGNGDSPGINRYTRTTSSPRIRSTCQGTRRARAATASSFTKYHRPAWTTT
jgi:hypothetical protein